MYWSFGEAPPHPPPRHHTLLPSLAYCLDTHSVTSADCYVPTTMSASIVLMTCARGFSFVVVVDFVVYSVVPPPLSTPPPSSYWANWCACVRPFSPLFVGGWEHTDNVRGERVFNLQTGSIFIDIRIPIGFGPDLSSRSSLSDLTVRISTRRWW